MAASIVNTDFLSDDQINLGAAIRGTVPALPPIETKIQVVTSNHPATLAYLAVQLKRAGKNKLLIVRILASAVMHIFKDATNITGSTVASTPLTGLDIFNGTDDADPDESTMVITNLEDSAGVTVGEIAELADADGDELAAYFGVLFLAGVKKRTDDNRSAFIEKRIPSVQALVIGELQIFSSESGYLSDTILDSIYVSFNSMALARSHMIKRTAAKMGKLTLGAQTAFTTMFMLLENQGMGSLKIIREAVLRYSWIRTSFPELRSEFAAAHKGQVAIMRAVPAERSFVKAIYGSAFVPVAQSDIVNLLGVAKTIMVRVNPNYRQFNGGTVTPQQEARINAMLSASDELADHQTVNQSDENESAA